MFKYFFSNQQLTKEYLDWIWQGLVITIWISFLTIIFSTILSCILVATRESRILLLRWLTIIYISLFRNTPLLIQLFFWYFAIGNILPVSIIQWLNTSHQLIIFSLKITWPSFEFLAGLISLILYSTPFITEELRSGIYAVKYEQKFAALALGLIRWQVMRYIILPQALKISFSPLLGQYMNIVKNSSLTMAIGVAELSYISRQIESQSLQTFMAFGITTILYITIIAIIEALEQCRKQHLINKGKFT
ncbi:Inner membrane amino-acid ABC transporter permease protein YecS [Candidatus Arsenophonus lipoptenae]|uniref:Inner membrane amino-acid ABC transporter permease protein YecS n=1 Tax=Candidatus Arsenophonus lipoptenae TaxID=634113 RepID=A0A0X9VZ02_9GAMM|nr:amino acid ABC transporter permease [Candidatus Arsenophonus lipoptenae]AMA64910.1 Inner membrane amino-acid ABC transporter permease protein YecS [Candidatus Arsenophonus lipoptenae]